MKAPKLVSNGCCAHRQHLTWHPDCVWPPTARSSVLSSVEHSQLLNYIAELETKVAGFRTQSQARALESSPNARTPGQRENSMSTQSPHTVTNDSQTAQESGLPMETVLLSFGATAEPLFAGATSGLSMSRIVQVILGQDTPQDGEEDSGSRSINEVQPTEPTDSTGLVAQPTPLSASEEDALVEAFFSKVHPRYPVLDKVSFCQTFARRHQASEQSQPVDAAHMFFVNMIYAIGSRIFQLHFDSSMKQSPEASRC